MITTLRQVMSLLTRRERIQASLLLIAVLLTAFVEMAGVASILPFIALLSNPEAIETNRVLAFLYETFEFSEQRSFFLFVGFLVFSVIVLSNLLMAVTLWGLYRFSHMRGHALAERLLTRYMARPYSYFLERNTSEMAKNILSEVTRVVNGILVPGVQVIAKGVVACVILVLLLIIDPWLAVIVGGVLGGAYAGIFAAIRGKLQTMGREAVIAGAQRFKLTNEALGGIKEVRILGREKELVRQFVVPSWRLARHQTTKQVLSLLPKHLIEPLAFGGIVLITLYLIGTERDLSEILPLLALYAFAGYRLMPAAQQIFGGISSIRFSLPALDILMKDLGRAEEYEVKEYDGPKIRLEEAIEARNLSFSYAGTAEPAIKDLSLRIQRGTSIALVGSTGAGKTTLADILLGLLQPDTGALYVDGIEVTPDNVRAWQQNLGYVPQSIFLTDDTVAANIAFGVSPGKIDRQGVEEAARLANLHDFITQELPAGYDTVVGDRGVRLSGGQRQRIGIARALYRDPEVMVLDEATSALDGITEDVIMEAIRTLGGKKTIIMIAHRLTTVRECDVIYLLERGKVKDSGTYDQLMQGNDTFRHMAGKGS